MTDLQRFKENDEIETKMIAVAMPTLEGLGADRDDFFAGAFSCFLLGDVLYDLDRDPMSGVITREVYRSSFPAIHQLFIRPGTFEFYLTVFRSIWGEDVDVTFTIPSPGVLEINVESIGIDLFEFAAREIVDNEYVFSPIVDEEGDSIMFQDTVGIKTESEIDALMEEISPEGIFTTTTLSL